MALVLKALTAALSIVVGISVGVLWFVIARTCEPFHPQDVRFYFALYTDIGAASGLFSWYMATLVNGRRVRLGSALLVLAIPFLLIFLLSQSLNPFTAYVVVMLFMSVSLPSCVVAIRKRRPNA